MQEDAARAVNVAEDINYAETTHRYSFTQVGMDRISGLGDLLYI